MSGPREDRTPDLGVISTTLYRLSYRTVLEIVFPNRAFKSFDEHVLNASFKFKRLS